MYVHLRLWYEAAYRVCGGVKGFWTYDRAEVTCPDCLRVAA